MLFKKGQNLTELALLIGIVSLVLIGMEVYFRRGLNAKVKDLTDTWIGNKQEAYQQDTSGLAIYTSESTYTFKSTATVAETAGGKKSLKSKEDSTVGYHSETKD